MHGVYLDSVGLVLVLCDVGVVLLYTAFASSFALLADAVPYLHRHLEELVDILQSASCP